MSRKTCQIRRLLWDCVLHIVCEIKTILFLAVCWPLCFSHTHFFFFFSDSDDFLLDPITCWNRLIFSYTETLPPRAFPARGNAEETTHWDHLNSHSLMKWDEQIKKKVHWDFPQHGKNMQKQKAPFLNHIYKAKFKKKRSNYLKILELSEHNKPADAFICQRWHTRRKLIANLVWK